jgi:hypothetical protein
MKRKTLESFFKAVGTTSNSQSPTDAPDSVQVTEQNLHVPNEIPQELESRIGSMIYERDPDKRPQIWEYPQN